MTVSVSDKQNLKTIYYNNYCFFLNYFHWDGLNHFCRSVSEFSAFDERMNEKGVLKFWYNNK
jgi:hypothetical protein